VKIYLVQESDYDSYDVLKAFFNKEDAEQLQQKIDDYWLLKPRPIWSGDLEQERARQRDETRKWNENHVFKHPGYCGGPVNISEIEVE
jgi:hypothetical protein